MEALLPKHRSRGHDRAAAGQALLPKDPRRLLFANVLGELTPFAEFRRHEAICAVCSRMKPVTSATVDVVDDNTTTPEEMRTLVTRTELYRNWRIDLLSYRISTGWRPLVLVKGPAESLTPDTPSLLWGTFRSKTEADRYAL